MPIYTVKLTRCYDVQVRCDNAEEAKHYAEFFLSDPLDLATPQQKWEHSFSIGLIKPTLNEAFECERTDEV